MLLRDPSFPFPAPSSLPVPGSPVPVSPPIPVCLSFHWSGHPTCSPGLRGRDKGLGRAQGASPFLCLSPPDLVRAGLPRSRRWDLGPAPRKGMGTGKGRRRGAARAGIGAGPNYGGAGGRRGRADPCSTQPCVPSPKTVQGRGRCRVAGGDLCREAWSPGVTLSKCRRILPFSQSVVPGRSPASPGPSDCGWQKPRVGQASSRSRKKVGRPASGPLAWALLSKGQIALTISKSLGYTGKPQGA